MDKCVSRTNEEFERVFYKNNYAAGVAINNIYMVFLGLFPASGKL